MRYVALLLLAVLLGLAVSGCHPVTEEQPAPLTMGIETTTQPEPVQTSPPLTTTAPTPMLSQTTTPPPAPTTPTPTSTTPTFTYKPPKTIWVEADPDKGFHWAYYLYIPSSAYQAGSNGNKTYLLVEPNNTGYPDDALSVHDAAARKQIEYPVRKNMAERLGVPLLFPTFPRPVPSTLGIYPQALCRFTLLSSVPEYLRIDLQLIAMIEDAARVLEKKGIWTEEKHLMNGFSASGMFTSRFIMIHPDKVQVAAIGSPSGWPIVPLVEWNGMKLEYPVGVADMERVVGHQFNGETFRSVPLYVFIGDEDDNDSVTWPGRQTWFTYPGSGWRLEDQQLLINRFGSTPLDRWPIAEEIYESVGANAQFVLYPGLGHVLTNQMWMDIENFFRSHIKQDG